MRQVDAKPDVVAAAPAYTGTANLEAMAGADNYNNFQLDLVRRRLRPGARVLDFGAGIGTFANALRASGCAPLCVEPDRAQAAVIAASGLPVVHGIAEVADGSIDFAYSFNVMEHIADDVAAMQALRRSIAPGGQALIYVPAFQVLFTDMDRLVGHERRYRAAELRSKLASAGFQVNSVLYADALGFFATLVYKWTDRSAGHINPRALKLYDRVVFPVSRLLDVLGVSRLLGKNVYALVTAR